MRKLLLVSAIIVGMGIVAGCGSDDSPGSEPAVKGTVPEPKTATPDMKSPEERGRAAAGGGGEGS